MAEDAHLLTDLRLLLRQNSFRPVYSIDTDRRRVGDPPAMRTDLGIASGRDNLAQAIILRLLTPVGELSALDHPEYGSRLPDLVGSDNVERTRNLAKLYILESLRWEPRIEKVTQLVVEPAPGTRDRINVSLEVKPVASAGRVAIGPFTLELGR